MTTEFKIEKGHMPIPQPAKRGPKKDRIVAIKAAEAIRNLECNTVTEAALKYFHEHIGVSAQLSTKEIRKRRKYESFKNFRDYIYYELEDGERSIRIDRLIEKRNLNRDIQRMNR